MATLMNKNTHEVLVSNLKIAKDFYSRGKGLLGRSSLPSDEGLWILYCNSIHTFFMKFSIDCIFLDGNLKVKSLKRNIKPWRLVLPIWGASSVIELAAGTLEKVPVKVGDQLYVGT